MIQKLLYTEKNSSYSNNYSKFVLYRDLQEFQCNPFTQDDCGRTILKTRQFTFDNSDKTIVKSILKCFNNNYSKFNIFLIFNRAFESSYSEAINEYDIQPKAKRIIPFLMGYYDVRSFVHSLPIEIIHTIAKIHILLPVQQQPSCREFQANIWNFILPVEDQIEIIKQLKK